VKTKYPMVMVGPASRLKEALSQAGFARDFVHRSTYRLDLETSDGAYVLQVPYEEAGGVMALYGEMAFFDGIADSEVPKKVMDSALERWLALRNRLEVGRNRAYSPDRGDRRPSGPSRPRSLESARNGSMVQDFSDLQRLGKDMARMKTGRQLGKEGLVDDPIQY